ncbi:MAG: Gfo/Idh/MocA family oxidoreductase [Rhodospirillaceae bacterium]|jgi:predicted dehydrogenase|nr:Gfo/Idh/MocA family oxidoreductase [Rhodospirillaceae bacterium]MBT7758856.1 Gfo/Idh/MocA family oxidoreductase [Rhodospirillaceae bacterium]
MKVGIIGAGLQGRRRAPVIRDWPGAEIKIITAETLESAQPLANEMGAAAGAGWRGVVDDPEIDVVMVLTPPDLHAPITIAAIQNGKHVFCEKPLSRTLAEGREMVAAAAAHNKVLKCGFNHRHHPAIAEAKRLFDQGELGRITFARCRYGICGRPGYEDEWRADPERTPGGQFVEQGIHAIDLFRWFAGDIAEVTCMTGTQYFDAQPLDDNGMALLRAKSGALLSLHASLTNWKNLFSLEFFGSEGYLVVDGLGASYGTEKLIFGKRDFDKPFNDHVTEYRGGDISWKSEWQEFCDAVNEGRQPMGNGTDGLESLKVALAAYQAEQDKRVITIE